MPVATPPNTYLIKDAVIVLASNVLIYGIHLECSGRLGYNRFAIHRVGLCSEGRGGVMIDV